MPMIYLFFFLIFAYSIKSSYNGLHGMPGSKMGEFFSNLIMWVPKPVSIFLFFNWKVKEFPVQLCVLQILNYLLLCFSLIKRYYNGIKDMNYYNYILYIYLALIGIYAIVTIVDYLIFKNRNKEF